jgi:shikimate kinase/3-dehydroquinate synthase
MNELMGKRNLVLTGFMGTGKSVVGRMVAERLGREFLDSDKLIETRAGRSVPEIFEHHGEAYFRAMESDVCHELSAPRGCVVASGGWMLAPPDNRAAIEAGSLVVCLQADIPTLIERLGGAHGRPMLADADWQVRLEQLLAKRQPTYRSFPLQVDTSRLSIEQAADRVLSLWESFHQRTEPETLPVMAPGGDYAVIIGEHLIDRLGPLVKGLGRWTNVAVVSDEVVGPLYAGQAAASLEAAGLQVTRCTMPAGEAHKTLATVSDLYNQFLRAGLDRSGLVVALGGGVVGDVVGFAAATYMRGLPLVQVPTTLLAMIDSGVGGKTGVDLPAGKNLVGAFKQPALVVVDPGVLASLPSADFRAGLAEVVKAGIIGSPELFDRLEDGQTELPWIVREAAAVKIDVVQTDPYEQGRRAVLNLGHTFGHAFERLSNYQLRHGEAVSMGMAVATRLAMHLEHCPPDVGQRIIGLLDHLGLPTTLPDYAAEAVWEAMTSDKKKRGKRMRFVLPLDIGQVDIFDDVPRETALAVLRNP